MAYKVTRLFALTGAARAAKGRHWQHQCHSGTTRPLGCGSSTRSWQRHEGAPPKQHHARYSGTARLSGW